MRLRTHLLFVSCLGLLLAAAATGAQEPASTDKATAKDIEWTGGLGASSAWRNDDVPFWVQVVNKSDAPVESIRFRPVGGDVAVVIVCGPGREPPCVMPDTSVTVPANTDRTFEGVLRVDGTGERELALLLTAAGHQWSVPLGKLVSNGWAERFKLLSEIAALPIFGGAALFLYDKWTRRREALEKKAAEDREHLERDLTKRRADDSRKAAEHAATVRVMLPIVHDYAVGYYGAMAASARQFYDEVAKDAPDVDEALFWYVRVQLKTRVFGQQVGSFYLATLAAEKIVEHAWSLWLQSVFPPAQVDARRAFKLLLDALQQPSPVDKSPSEVEDRLLSAIHFHAHVSRWADGSQGKKAFNTVKKRLSDWCKNNRADFGYAWLYGKVMQRETDLLFEQWYGAAPEAISVPKEHLAIATTVCGQLEDKAQAQAARTYLGLNDS